MKQTWSKFIPIAFILALVLVGLVTRVRALGTVSLITIGIPYTQDFDTLASSGTSSVVPTGWDFFESGTNANLLYSAGTGSSNAGDTYSFGATSNTERAFGGLLSGSLTPLVGAQFTNDTGSTITSLDIAYTGEQWRVGVTNRNAADRLDFQFSTNATSLNTGTWVDYDSLDFNGPVINGTAGALNGNLASNRTTLSFTITGLNIASGSSFWIRWADLNIASSDDGLSIDDFSLTPNGAAPTVNLSVSDVSANEGNAGTTSFDFTVSLAAPAGAGGVTFDIATQDNSATLADNDYVATSLTGQTIPAGSSSYNFTILVNGDTTTEPDETFFVNVTNVVGADVVDGQGQGTIVNDDTNVCAQSFTPIYNIQGSGLTPAITGVVTTKGVVVGDYEGPTPAQRGFFIQDEIGDGNQATSDGIFVFNGNNNTVSLGDVLYVTGTAGDFQDQTQISNVSNITICGTSTVAPVDVTFPVPSLTYLEQYEGMLVRLPQTMVVTEHFQLGRFGQVVLSAGGKLQQPTNVVAPGAPALALQAQNNLSKIILDDDSQGQNPDPILFGRNGSPLSASNTLRGGDTATNTIGVMTYTWAGNAASGNAYRVRPINALNGFVNFVEANSRPTIAPVVGGDVKVVGMNLLNFFNTFADGNSSTPGCFPGGGDSDCRGANSATEFTRQYQKTVAAILAMNPDVLGINEIENDGYGPDSSLQFLVDQLNAATAPGTYAFIDVDANTGQTNAMGADAIRVAMLYKPAVVTPIGQTSPLNTVAFVNGGDSAPRNRVSLAQAFQLNSNGAVFIVDVNHLKSKGSACAAPDAGDGQGNCNQVRVNAATELMNWFATDPTGTGDPDILMIGDYNSYAMEDPITVIKNAGFVNLIESFLGPDAYSYVFDGQWGYLDHALGSASLVPQVTGVGDYHINSDEPSVLDYNVEFKSAGQIISLFAPDQFRISDHDSVVIGLDLNAPPTADAGGPYNVAEGGSVLVSATGSDPDNDALIYDWDLDNNGSFETSGQSATFSAALLDGPSSHIIYVRATDSGGLTAVAQTSVTVHNVAPVVGEITASSYLAVVNTPIQTTATLTDTSPLDTHTAVWSWGDGSTSAGNVTESNGAGTVTGEHSYLASGVYTVRVTVTDDDGDHGQSILEFIVIYNPSGGYLTGVGSIDSPATAFAANPDLTGPANFGMYARYVGSALTGKAQFSFPAANLLFRSSSFDWLVVSGDDAVYRGQGTINGRGHYGFIVTVFDGRNSGAADRFRIRIWDMDNGNAEVYDNGYIVDNEPTQAISAGKIDVYH